MKVLFLDIDGVLNTFRTNLVYGAVLGRDIDAKDKLDPLAMDFLKLLIDNNVAIVVSSTWRLGRTVSELTDILGMKIHDKTCSFPFPGSVRGDEIKIWLDSNPGVSNYCILDDDSDMLDHQLAFFVKTNYKEGISYLNMLDVVKILNIDNSAIFKRAKAKKKINTDTTIL